MNSPARTTTALIRAVRPRQWLKNLLVLAAPIAAGTIDELSTIQRAALTFVAFTMASSAIYLINDVRDVEEDRRHPRKCKRPIAAGELPIRVALLTGTILAVSSIGLALTINPETAATIGVYIAIQLAYAFWLKDQPVIDLAIVSAGFLLRAIAGGVAAEVPLSQWFLLVASFGSLFMVAGKRYSELHNLGSEIGTRRSLEAYSVSYLRFVWSLAAAVTITAYSLWAFEISTGAEINWQAISIAPFVIGLLRYAVDIDLGGAGEPEDVVLRDPVLQVIAALWLVTFAMGVYSS